MTEAASNDKQVEINALREELKRREVYQETSQKKPPKQQHHTHKQTKNRCLT